MLLSFLMGVMLSRDLMSPSSTYGNTDLSQQQRQTEAVEDTTSSSSSTTAMGLWWMSNLRATPLRMTEEDTAAMTGSGSGGGGGGSMGRQLAFPPETKTVWIDVGVHRETDFIPDLDQDDSLFVLGFEPSDMWKPCPHRHCVVFWAACTPDYDVVNLNVQNGGNLCNSLLKPNSDTKSNLWRGCVEQLVDEATGKPVVVQVPGIPLHALVERIPDHIEVEYIKIDAQGFDLEVMKGALAAPHGRIQVVSLETMDVDDESKLLYHGQPLFVDLKEYLESKGWIYVKSVHNHGVAGEMNAFFVSHDQYVSKVARLADVLMSNKEGQGK